MRIFNFRNLTFIFAFILFITSAVVLLVATIINVYFNFQNQKGTTAYMQQQITQRTADTVTSFIQGKFNSLTTAAHFGHLAIASYENKKHILEQLSGLEQAFRQLAIINQQEEVITISRETDVVSGQFTNQALKELFTRVSTGNQYMGEISIDSVTFEPMAIIAIPVTDVSGDLTAIVAAELNLKFMWHLVENMVIGKNGLVYVVDRLGNLIAFSDRSRVLSGENLSYLKEVHKFVHNTGQPGKWDGISKGIQNTWVVDTYAALIFPDWAVVTELPVIEAYKNIITSIMTTIIAILFCLIPAISVGVYISRYISKPIIDLRNAVKKIGKGFMETTIQITSKDEIGELAMSFNQMVEDLKKTTVSRNSLAKEIIERKSVETQLRKAEEKYRKQFEGALDAIFMTDSETGEIIDCNPEATRLTGLKKGEIIGKPHYFLHSGDKNEKKIAYNNFRIQQDKTIESKIITKKGEIKDVEIKANLLEIGGRKVQQSIFRDITERKKAEKKLQKYIREIEAANKELDDFTYIVSHDLKEPLRSIDAFSKFLLQDYQDRLDKEGKNFLNRIRVNCRRMQSLIEDLLEISRLGKKKNPFKQVKVEQLIDEAKSRLEHVITEKNAKIIILTKLPELFCDPVRLTEVFANLLSNALKFNDKVRPIIVIGCTKKNVYYEFFIKDNGPGINKLYHDKIFGIFQQLGVREENTGTGAGLTIVKKIIHLHNGKIWIESTLGESTTFYFSIPCNEINGEGGIDEGEV